MVLRYNQKADVLNVREISAQIIRTNQLVGTDKFTVDSEWVMSLVDEAGGYVLSQDQINKIDSQFYAVAEFSSTVPVLVTSFTGSAKLVIEGKEGNERHVTELLVTSNGTNTIATEYATLFTNIALYTVDVDTLNGNAQVKITPFNSSVKQYKITGSKM